MPLEASCLLLQNLRVVQIERENLKLYSTPPSDFSLDICLMYFGVLNRNRAVLLFSFTSQKDREYMIISATKRRVWKTSVIGPPLTIIDQIHSGEI